MMAENNSFRQKKTGPKTGFYYFLSITNKRADVQRVRAQGASDASQYAIHKRFRIGRLCHQMDQWGCLHHQHHLSR